MNFRRFCKTVFYLILFSLCLGSIYREFSSWFQPAWFTVLCINTVLALFVYFRPLPYKVPLTSGALAKSNIKLRLDRLGKLHPKFLYLPAVVVATGSTLLALVSSMSSDTSGAGGLGYMAFVIVLWVPVVEEILFRRGFGLAFREWAGPLWGGYFSAIFFAIAHAQPTFQSVLHEGIGISLGPLLLGFCVEFLYSLGQYLLGPCIALHAACNFSAVAFQMIDPRWLDWLSLLYI